MNSPIAPESDSSRNSRSSVSVVIPTYNRANIVLRALRSVFDQTDPVQEVLLIDDGSTDNTEAVVRQAYGARVRYIRQANAGVSAARNRGIRASHSDLVAFLDSDDLWLPEKTRLQVEFMHQHPAFGMVLCDVERVSEDGSLIDVLRRREVLPADGMIFRDVLRNSALVPASAMVRREVFDSVGVFDESLRTAEDLDFHLRVARLWPIGVVERPLVRAIRGHGGLSAAPSAYDDLVAVYLKIATLVRGEVPPEELDTAVASAYLRRARGALIGGRWLEAGRSVVMARGLSRHAVPARVMFEFAWSAVRRTASMVLRK